MPRNAENDQQSNAENDHPQGSASSHLRRYRRGRHASNAKLGPLLERAAANLAALRKPRTDPRTAGIDDTIALARKFKVVPLGDGLHPNLAFPRWSTLKLPTPKVAASIAASIAVGALGIVSWTVASPVSAAPENRPHAVAAADPAPNETADRTRTSNAASRSHNRVTAVPGAAVPGAVTTAQKPQGGPQPIKPVAGLTDGETANAIAIIQTGQEMNLPKRAFVVAIATTLQESYLHNLANPNVPDSLNIRSEGMGQDYDSVGLFQQRASMGWGTVEQLMNPKDSSRAFYNRLMSIAGWDQMSIAAAAQAVQGSAFPDAYAKWEGLARQIVDALT